MTTEPRFLTLPEVEAIHRMQIAAFGGAGGTRDSGMLESALGRPVSRWHYEDGSVTRMATDYAFEIARNHPFIDGNKRTAFMAAYTFLGLNGYGFNASEANVVVMIVALSAGEVNEEALADWFEEHAFPTTS